MTPLQEQQINSLIQKMNLEYDFEIIPIQIESYSREKQCYSNVEEKVRIDGGKIHYGWSVHFNEGIIIEAERHAVWENEEEELICITPHPSNKNELIFLSDNTFVDPELQIDNVRMNITNNPLVKDWIYLSDIIGQIYYKYTDRINDEQVNVESPVLEVLNKIEEWRGYVMGLIKIGRKERSYCYCFEGANNKKKYLHCHSKFYYQEIPKLLENIKQFVKR